MLNPGPVVLSGLASVFDAGKNIVAKKVSVTVSLPVTMFVWIATAAAFYLTIFLVTLHGAPAVPAIALGAYWVFFVRVFFEFIGMLAYLKAMKMGEASVVAPLLGIIPGLTLVTSFAFAHELPSVLGSAGVLVTVIGLYAMDAVGARDTTDTIDWLKPWRTLHSASILRPSTWTPSHWMLLASVSWALTTTLHKIALATFTPGYYTTASTLLFTVALLPYVLWQDAAGLRALFRRYRDLVSLILLGLLNGLGFAFMIFAQAEAPSALVVALKLTSGLLTLPLAWLFFREPIKARWLPAGILLVGAFMVALATH